jgi:hypothetical protein
MKRTWDQSGFHQSFCFEHGSLGFLELRFFFQVEVQVAFVDRLIVVLRRTNGLRMIRWSPIDPS